MCFFIKLSLNKNFKNSFLGILSLLITFLGHGQIVRTDNSIHTPLGAELSLNAVFGDLRNNHFHTGLDFGTKGKIDIPIYSIQEGFVSRIKISPTGYGKVLYIDHPNGHTSVYAHCNRFSDKIDAFCLEFQKKLKLNEIDTILPKNVLNIEFGELIAFSGNTGNSSGPHLHFEIRETSSEKPLNPLNHGFILSSDTYAPIIKEIKIYALNKEGFMIPDKIITKRLNNGIADELYTLQLPDNFVTKNEHIGISFKAYDKFSSKGSLMGIFGSRLYSNNELLFSFQFDTLNFDYSRYINEHIDYSIYKKTKQRFHKLFRNNNNDFNLYKGNGFLEFSKSKSIDVQISVFDFSKNIAPVRLKIYAPKVFKTDSFYFESSKYYIPKDSISFKYGNFHIACQPNSLFQPVEKVNFLSSNTTLSKPVRVSSKEKNNISPKNYFKINGTDVSTKLIDNEIFCESKSLGSISMSKDNNAPIVVPINFSSDKTFSQNTLKFKIYDNETAVKDYHLYVNDQWIRVYYDKKRKTITSEPILDKGELNIKFVVNDLYGNSKNYNVILNK